MHLACGSLIQANSHLHTHTPTAPLMSVFATHQSACGRGKGAGACTCTCCVRVPHSERERSREKKQQKRRKNRLRARGSLFRKGKSITANHTHKQHQPPLPLPPSLLPFPSYYLKGVFVRRYKIPSLSASGQLINPPSPFLAPFHPRPPSCVTSSASAITPEACIFEEGEGGREGGSEGRKGCVYQLQNKTSSAGNA